MIAIATTAPAVTMTSLELVEYINSQRAEGEAVLQHRDFTAKVPKVLGDGVCEKFRTPYVNPQNGQTYQMYCFPKREACLMAMSYSYDLQAKVFDRMTQLEQVAADRRIPKTYGEALRLAADQAEEIARKDAQLAILTPKVEALDRLETGSDGSFCLTDAAKALQTQPRKFIARLQQMGWIFRRPMGSDWLAHQDRIKTGVLEHKVTTGKRFDSTEWVSTQVRVTAKGMARLGLIFAKEEAQHGHAEEY